MAKLWIWIVSTLAVIGAIWYLALHRLPIPPTAITTATTTETTTTAPMIASASILKKANNNNRTPTVSQTSGYGSIQSLIALRTDLICSISESKGATKRSGTVYIANDMMRGDFFTTTAISMIDNGTELYAWKSGNTQGIELSAVKSVDNAAIAIWGAIDPTENLNYICHPWIVNPDFFTLPMGIIFSATGN